MNCGVFLNAVIKDLAFTDIVGFFSNISI